MLTAERLRELLEYDPETGAFTWLMRVRSVAPGQTAGTVSSKARYVAIGIDGRYYQAHRLAWLYVYGHWPDGEIDHIDGQKRNNAIANLRVATRAQNEANKSLRRDNKAGVKGVTFNPLVNKWHARIGFRGRSRSLGYHETAEEAGHAYAKAAQQLFGDFANTRSERS